nr:EOG090X0DEG [Polyphemus pediculus]
MVPIHFNRRSLESTGSFIVVFMALISVATAFHSHQDSVLTDAYLRGIMNRLGDKMVDAPEGYLDYPLPSYEDMMNPTGLEDSEKEYEEADRLAIKHLHSGLSLRDQEYLKHSSLFSNQEPTDVATESTKGDNVLPAYCNPPNPCPIGYTAEDGCVEEFENTAAFSREFQAAQDCMCDTEHMFDCPASSKNSVNGKNRISAKAATANMVDTAIRKIMSDFQGEHKSVSKKILC